MKLLTIVALCYNEGANVDHYYERVTKVIEKMPNYRFEIIFVDNASTDDTVPKLKAIAARDKSVKIIVNLRNFGAVRSGYYGFMQGYGDAVIPMATDLQDPPEVIPELVAVWENGEMVVVATKAASVEHGIIYALRTLYYKWLNALANVKLIEHFTGYGVYDQSVVAEFRKLGDVYPYFRGLLSELGYEPARVNYVQPARYGGKSHSNWYHLYDLAMLGLTSHSILPMRIATIAGFVLALVCFLIAAFYFVYKLFYWNTFAVGMAPLVIGVFGIFSIQLMFTGLLGEYIGASHRQILRRPLVVERERVNFDNSNQSKQAHKAEQPQPPERNIDVSSRGGSDKVVEVASETDAAEQVTKKEQIVS